MHSWIIIAIAAQIIFAVATIFDKAVVTAKKVLHPFSYAFYVCLLSALSVIIFFFDWLPLPMGIETPSIKDLLFPTWQILLFSLLIGYLLFIALVNLYEALSKSDASDVSPVVASFGAVGTLMLEFYLLKAEYSLLTILGILLLVLGTFLISNLRLSQEVFFHTIVSGIAFGAYYTFIKYIFVLTNFDTGFLYTRLGVAIAALSIILIPAYRRRIFRKLNNDKGNIKKAAYYIICIKIVSGLASLMTLKAIQMGSVAVVQALSGVQFMILILFSIFFSHRTPDFFGEKDQDSWVLAHKIFVSIIISVGLYLIFL